MRRFDQLAYAVVDVETTGLFASKYDRVIEIAVCRYSPDGHRSEFVSLVNPGRDLGPTGLHGLSPRDLMHAPKFAEIVGDVLSYVWGAVVVGHNVRFDLSFIESECTRAGVDFPQVPALCTLQLASKLGKSGKQRSLGSCCEECGIQLRQKHSALDDARAAGELLQAYLSEAQKCGHQTIDDLGCTAPFPVEFPSPTPSGRRLCRTDAQRLKNCEPSYLSRLVTRLMGRECAEASSSKLVPYFDLLDRVLEDRLVNETESESLYALAAKWNLTGQEVCAAHREYLVNLVSAALADGIVTESEKSDLDSVSQMLGFDTSTVDGLLSGADLSGVRIVSKSSSASNQFKGKTVCFTGESQCKLNGEIITRDLAEDLASREGLDVLDNVTKALDILVVADPHSQSRKAQKARQYGTRIIAEAAFWRSIGVDVE